MNVGFIGAGRVGKALGKYLLLNSFSISGYFSRSYHSALEAANFTNSIAFSEIGDLIKSTDVIAITTPDDTIEKIVISLNKSNVSWEYKSIFHVSGVNSSELLSPLLQKGATVFSLHPMLSFGDVDRAVTDLKNAFFTIEGTGKKYRNIVEQFKELKNPLIEVNAKDKVLYHAAATVMSNYLVTIVYTGIQMLNEIGFSEEATRQMIAPLLKKTLDNTIDLGPAKALTGPISRADIGTLKKHLESLSKQSSWLEIYKVLGKQTMELAIESGRISESNEKGIKEVLNKNDEKGDNCNI